MITSRLLLGSLFIISAIGIAGCESSTTKKQNQPAQLVSPAKEQPADASSGQASTEESSGLAELSVEDRESAKKQGVCPVSGELLGAMGKPFKTTVKGKTVFLCCEGCEQELKNNPDKYLAKLKDTEENK